MQKDSLLLPSTPIHITHTLLHNLYGWRRYQSESESKSFVIAFKLAQHYTPDQQSTLKTLFISKGQTIQSSIA